MHKNRGVKTRQLDDGIGDTLVLALEVLKIAGELGLCFRGTPTLERGSHTCFVLVVSAPLCGSCRLWLPLRESCRPAARHVGGIPAQPLVLRSGRFIFAVVLFSL